MILYRYNSVYGTFFAHIMLTIAYGIVHNEKGVYCKFGLSKHWRKMLKLFSKSQTVNEISIEWSANDFKTCMGAACSTCTFIVVYIWQIFASPSSSILSSIVNTHCQCNRTTTEGISASKLSSLLLLLLLLLFAFIADKLIKLLSSHAPKNIICTTPYTTLRIERAPDGKETGESVVKFLQYCDRKNIDRLPRRSVSAISKRHTLLHHLFLNMHIVQNILSF